MWCHQCGFRGGSLPDSMGRRPHYPWEGHICSENVRNRNYDYARRQMGLLPKDEQWNSEDCPTSGGRNSRNCPTSGAAPGKRPGRRFMKCGR